MKNNYWIILACLAILISSCEKKNLNNVKDNLTLSRNGADMPVYIYGNAKSKVFVITLHGGPGGNGLSFRSGWNDELEDKYAMVYWDQRGSGMAQGKLNRENFTLEEMKKDVMALVSVLKDKYGDDIELFLMGHSWGGTLAMVTLLDQNQNNQSIFNGCIVASACANWCDLIKDEITRFNEVADAQIQDGNDVDHWNDMKTLSRQIDTVNCDDIDGRLNAKAAVAEGFLKKRGLINELTVSQNNRISKNLHVRNNYITFTFGKSGTNDFLFEDPDFNNLDGISTRLHQLSIPILVLNGKYDLHVPNITAQNLYNNIGSSNKGIKILEESAHDIFYEQPNEFANEVMNFIELWK